MASPPEDFNIIHPDGYAEYGYPHHIWTKLRAEDPVHWWTRNEGLPFWAITKHADIMEISKQPDIFISAPRINIGHEPERDRDEMQQIFPPTLIQMDGEQHTAFRKMISSRFTPRALRKIDGDIEAIGKEIVDALGEDALEGECDFVEKVSAPLPIAVIGWLLGVPKSDWPLLFDWTNRVIGAGDEEFQNQDTAIDTARTAMTELFTYFAKVVEEKKKNPADDLISLFNTLEYQGKRLELMDVLAWCLIIVIAGNETTRNGTSGGMLAFIENQDEMRKVQNDPSLLKPAVEECVRWSTPIIHFARTATQDYELRGKTIQKDQSVALFYPSANRDEEVFEDPFTFRVDRNPNRHLGFGIGEHFCAGSHVARLEMMIAYKHLLPRIEEVELAGPVQRLRSTLVGGVKHLPIRYKLRAPA